MHTHSTIQKLVTTGLLILSLISFLPKSYFHDVIAKHKDGITCTHPTKKTPCVHKQGYSCSFTDLVVTAPYEPTVSSFSLLPLSLQTALTVPVYAGLSSDLYFVTEGRGPPSVNA